MPHATRVVRNLYRDSVSLMQLSRDARRSCPASSRPRRSWRPRQPRPAARGRARRRRGAPRPERSADRGAGEDEAALAAGAREGRGALSSRRAAREPRAAPRRRCRRAASQMALAADAGRELRADLGARRLRRRRGDEGAAARPERHAVQRQRVARRRTRAQALRARARTCMVMGPDCGTAIINGVPLGFANVVRRGADRRASARRAPGLQEVTVLDRPARARASRRRSAPAATICTTTIGGISMLHGLARARRRPRHQGASC